MWLTTTGVASQTVAPATGADAAALFARLRDAAEHLNYEGTLVFGSGPIVASSRVAHFCVNGRSYERVEQLTGERRQEYRQDGMVHTVWPAERVATVEQHMPAADPRLTSLPDANAADSYRIAHTGTDRIADREVEVLMLQPVDLLRYPQRLWVDRLSGLLLRADVLSESGLPLEFSTFSDIRIGGRPRPEKVTEPVQHLAGYRIQRSPVASADLLDEGWSIPAIPGFKLIGCSRRPLVNGGAFVANTRMALQSVFSDGMTHVSVFIEAYDPAHHRPQRSTVGAAHTLAERRGDWWITIVGDVPMATVQRFADALVRRH
jgi:sigma-E factor negative regulatory protein RseB